MRILVTGAAGMLGTALVPSLLRSGHEAIATDLNVSDPNPWSSDGSSLQLLDVRDRRAVKECVEDVGPDMVVHLAAETDLEACELDRDHAFMTNALGTRFVANACQEHHLPLAYVSTAGVFDGTKSEPYTEFDEPNPINVYGESKLAGERIVAEVVDRSFVVRAGWMVGGGPGKDHKFVSRILDQLALGQQTIYAVSDKAGTPTYTGDFSSCFSRLVASESYGLYHMCCEGTATRFDVARLILDSLGQSDVELVPVDSAHFQDEFFAPRPGSETMRNMALELQGLNTMRPWDVALAEYVRSEYGGLSADALRIDDPPRPSTDTAAS